MPGAKGVRAGRAFVELFADDTKLVRALRRAQKRLASFGEGARAIGTKLTAAGGAAVAAFGAAIGVFVKAGDALDKMSIRTGLSVETLSELAYAASQSGADLESLEKGVRTMQRTINDAERGLSTAKDALAELGLSFADLQGLSPEEQFLAIADRVSKIEDPSKRAAVAMQVLGKAGTQLLPLMQNGAKGIEQLREQARKLGLTISTDAAKQAASLGDRIDELKRVVRAGAITIGATLAPALEGVVKAATRAIVIVNAWIGQNRAMVVLAAKVALGVLALGAALLAIGGFAAVAAFAVGGLITIITTAGAVIGGVAGAIGAIVSPIGLVIAALAAGGVAFFRFTAAGQTALAFLVEKFGALLPIVQRTIEGVRDALAAGDLGLAAKVLWAGLKLVWLEGTKEIRDTWAGGLYAMRKLLLSVSIGMQRVWASFSSGVRSAWEVTQNYLAKKFIELQGLFDDSLDVEAAKQGLEQQSRDNLTAITREAEDALKALDREQSKREQELLDDSLDRLDERRKALVDAKRNLDKAIADAKQKREDAAADSPDAPTLSDRFRDLLDGVDVPALERRISVAGTFNGAAVSGFGGQSAAAERTAKATEETARYVRRLSERAQTGGLTFA